jgi:hypothetical protein
MALPYSRGVRDTDLYRQLLGLEKPWTVDRVLSLDYGLATLWIGASSIAAGALADARGEADATWWLAALGGGYGVSWLVWSLGAAAARPAADQARDAH